MTFFIQLRTTLRQTISTHEEVASRVLRFVVSLISLLTINQVFGYQKSLSHWWVSLLVACICMFFPMSGAALIIAFIALMQLMTLSTGVAAVALIILALSYGICGYFSARDTYNFVTVPVCMQWHVPFFLPVEAGLFRDFRELATVICGSVLSFYLKTVKENASAFLDSTSDMTVASLLQTKLLGNTMFYIFLISMVVCFLVIYYVRGLAIAHGAVWALSLGVMAEFILMLSGYLFAGSRSDIPALIGGNVVVLLVGYVMIFFFRGLDYSRIEKIQYEDDEYYYYVTAVPKARIEEQEKEIKKITEGK